MPAGAGAAMLLPSQRADRSARASCSAIREKDDMTTGVATSHAGGSVTATREWVYDLAEGSRGMRDLLGGKGAGVAEMTRILAEAKPLSPSSRRPSTGSCRKH